MVRPARNTLPDQAGNPLRRYIDNGALLGRLPMPIEACSDVASHVEGEEAFEAVAGAEHQGQCPFRQDAFDQPGGGRHLHHLLVVQNTDGVVRSW